MWELSLCSGGPQVEDLSSLLQMLLGEGVLAWGGTSGDWSVVLIRGTLGVQLGKEFRAKLWRASDASLTCWFLTWLM